MEDIKKNITFNDYEYRINIYMPEENENINENTPVLYVLDGEKYGILIKEIVKLQARNTYKTCVDNYIIVSIELTQDITKKRFYDYTRDLKEGNSAEVNNLDFEIGGAYDFNVFLESYLKKLVREELLFEPKKEVLFGHSLTAYYQIHLLESKPNLFTDYIIISPSVWWNNYEALDYDFSKLHKYNTKIYICAGELEGRLTIGVQKLKSNILNYENTCVDIFKDENHASILPTAISTGLRYIHENYNYKKYVILNNN